MYVSPNVNQFQYIFHVFLFLYISICLLFYSFTLQRLKTAYVVENSHIMLQKY